MPTGQPFVDAASVWSFGERSTINAGLSRYLAGPGGTSMASELAVVALDNGTLKNLRWSSAASTLTATGNRITLYVNGVATPLVATWNGSVKSGSGTADLIPIAPGDTLSMRIQLAAGSGNITRPRVSVGLEVPSGIPAMPPGSVIAFAGATAPPGWLVCDGSEKDRATYIDLYAAIGDAHGPGDGTSTFNLPDYRGMFLRGVNGIRLVDPSNPSSAPMDPDTDTRQWSLPGGFSGNAVGSVQGQSVGVHQHSLGYGTGDSTTMLYRDDPRRTGRLASFSNDAWNQPGLKWTNPEGTESRPPNAYVNFLIKT